MLAISESFILAERLGLSPQKLHEVVTHASGQCWIMDHYVPVANILENVPANHAYQPGFSLGMMLKDMHLSQDAAQHCKLQTPIANLATRLFQKAQDSGLGDLDFSAVIKLIE
jgi:3-hydroxyisobutyrate dehydrogenase